MPRDFIDTFDTMINGLNESYVAGMRGAKEDLRRRLAAIPRGEDHIEYVARFVGAVSDWLGL